MDALPGLRLGRGRGRDNAERAPADDLDRVHDGERASLKVLDGACGQLHDELLSLEAVALGQAVVVDRNGPFPGQEPVKGEIAPLVALGAPHDVTLAHLDQHVAHDAASAEARRGPLCELYFLFSDRQSAFARLIERCRRSHFKVPHQQDFGASGRFRGRIDRRELKIPVAAARGVPQGIVVRVFLIRIPLHLD